MELFRDQARGNRLVIQRFDRYNDAAVNNLIDALEANHGAAGIVGGAAAIVGNRLPLDDHSLPGFDDLPALPVEPPLTFRQPTL